MKGGDERFHPGRYSVPAEAPTRASLFEHLASVCNVRNGDASATVLLGANIFLFEQFILKNIFRARPPLPLHRD